MSLLPVLALLSLGAVAVLLLSRRSRLREIREEQKMLPPPERPDA